MYIRTDQLDGETDWKLRRSLSLTQSYSDFLVLPRSLTLTVEPPRKEIYAFNAYAVSPHHSEHEDGKERVEDENESVSLENTAWASTVIASSSVLGMVVYVGPDTRSILNASKPRNKMGLLDFELNFFSKVLFFIMVLLSAVLTITKGFVGPWYIYFFRFVLLLSSIIPISMRVNLDLGKLLYSYLIMKDKHMPGAVVRTSTIPEELGRISYLFTDKTGTLTENVMSFHTLQMEPPLCFRRDTLAQLREYLSISQKPLPKAKLARDERSRNAQRVYLMVTALALCHNVTPVVATPQERSRQSLHRLRRHYEPESDVEAEVELSEFRLLKNDRESSESDRGERVEKASEREYHASSPDEVALVKFAERVGVELVYRDRTTIVLEDTFVLEQVDEEKEVKERTRDYEVLNIFPFTSERKRMGIIVKDKRDGKIFFFLKGAESVMMSFIEPSDWLQEEVDNLARAGLRTLVVAYKELSHEEYQHFHKRYTASLSLLRERETQSEAVIRSLENELKLLGLTGVEDRLQHDVTNTLETLKNAGIKIWMLTGDKAETAICIGRSCRLIDRAQTVFPFIVRTKR